MRKKGRRLMGDINVVPYIDVMLVLLIIFMITAPLLQQGITVDLPNADAAPLDPAEDNEPLVLSIDSEGRFYLNFGETPDEPIDDNELLNVTAAVIRRNPETQVLLNGDEDVRHGRVVTAYVLLQQAGATDIGVMTDPVEAGRPADAAE
jgi:biopolymer transport protein TolR